MQSTSVDCGVVSSCGLAFGSNNGSGNMIVVAMRLSSTTSTITVSDSHGSSYTLAKSQNLAVDGDGLYVYYARRVAAGANTVAVQLNAAASIRFSILEYSGGFQIADQTSGGNASSTAPSSGNVTTTYPNELLFGYSANNNTVAYTYTAGPSYTIRTQASGATCTNCTASEDQIVSSISSYNASFTMTPSGEWGVILVTFR